MVLMVACSASGSGADWAFSPSVKISESYDSNIDFRFDQPEGDFISSIRPNFRLSAQSDEDQLSLDSTLNGLIYVKHPQLNRVETHNNGSWDRRWSERFSSQLGVSFIKTTALESQLEEAGIGTTLADQYACNLQVGGSYALSERHKLSLTGSTGRTWYPSQQSNLPDADSAQGRLALAWKLDEVTTIGLENLYSFKHYGGFSDDSFVDWQNVQFVRPALYWEYAFSETMSLTVGAGYRRTEIDICYTFPVIDLLAPDQPAISRRTFTTAKRSDSYDFWGTVTKQWSKRLSSSLQAGRDQYSDVDGVTYNHIFLGFGFDYRLSELTQVGIDWRYDSNSGIERGLNETHYFRVSPTVARKLTRDLTLRLGGSYQLQTRKALSPDNTDSADRMLIWAELVWYLPRLLAGE